MWTVDHPADSPFRRSIERIYENWTAEDIQGLSVLTKSKTKELREVGERALADYRLWAAHQQQRATP
jgi:hypothetical protein